MIRFTKRVGELEIVFEGETVQDVVDLKEALDPSVLIARDVGLEQNIVVNNTVTNTSHSTPTCELVNELSNRKGVNVYNIDPNVKLAMDLGEDGFTETGPFKIFIVKD